ncbi:hypothetical protein [Nocardia xishanensis]
MRAADDLYFDSISRVRLPRWSSGRIGLTGNAAAAVSLFGDGSTLAIAGAYRLTDELCRSPADIQAALRRYETGHRPMVDAKQQSFRFARAMLLPAARSGIAVRNTAARLALALAGPITRRLAEGELIAARTESEDALADTDVDQRQMSMARREYAPVLAESA